MAKAKAAAKKALTKTALFADLAEKTGLTKAQVGTVFDELSQIIVQQLGAKGPRSFTLPGLFKLKAIPKKAVKGGDKKENKLKPGTFYITKDKPAHVKVTARPLKSLKESLA